MLEILWTKHIKEKMRQYNISKKRILRIFENPERKEEGIVENTICAMQGAGRKRYFEIWIMYQKEKGKIKMISCWKYSGKSPEGKVIFPEKILKEMKNKNPQLAS